MSTTQEQRTYLISQMRKHADWMIQNVSLTLPTRWTDEQLAAKLVEDGYILLSRPVYDVTRVPTVEMDANVTRVDAYIQAVYDQLSLFINRVTTESEANPAALLNEFMAALGALAA